MDKPKDAAPSLVIAWDVQRKNRAKSPTVTPSAQRSPLSQVAEEIERPGSLVDAIVAKRKAAMPAPELEEPLEDDGYGEPLPELEMDDSKPEPDISASPKRLPFPTSRADAIRAKLKATRGF